MFPIVYGGVRYATPGLTVQPGVNNNALMPGMSLFSAHGGISTEGRVFVDGVSVNGPFGQNSVTQFAFDVANAQEMQVLVTDTLRAQGIAPAPTTRKNWDGSGAIGGPIARDRLWYLTNVRTVGIAQVLAAGMAPNLHTGDPTKWLYAPTPGVETRFTESKLDFSARLTSQVTKRNRVTFSYQPQYRCLGSTLTTSAAGCRVRGDDWVGAPASSETTAPEAGSGYQSAPVSLTQATWTSPVSSRQLIDAAVSRFWYGIIGNGSVPPDAPLGMIGVTESSGMYGRPNVSDRAPYGWGEYDTISWNWRAAWSYVIGPQSLKVGYQGTHMQYNCQSFTNPALMRYTFNGGVPTSLNYTATSQWDNANSAAAHSIFVQDQWTQGRVTLQRGLRYDRVTSWAPDGGNGTDQTTRFGSVPVRFGRMESVTGFNDLTPRAGVVSDLFGNGKTALKASAGKYLSAATADGVYSSQHQGLNHVRAVTNRSWTDSNGDRNVDCNLLSPAAQNTSATGGDVCGALTGSNLNFGNLDPNITRVDPAILSGWGVRPYNWNYGVSVQHEVRPGLSVDVGYNRRRWGNFFVTYNKLAGPSDYHVWTVPVPVKAKLPNSGGTESFVAITPAASARGSRSFMTRDETAAGERRTAYWHGLDANATARSGRITLQMGTSSGRGVRDTCALWRARPQLQGSNSADACAVTESWITSFRGLASYRIPGMEVLVSTSVRSTRTVASENASNGSSLSANYQIPNTLVQQLLGRLPAGATAAQNTTVNLLSPGELYPLERRTEADLRPAKILRFGRSRFDVGVDFYNLLNANTTTSYQQTYLYTNNGATWLDPTAILAPRLARLHATLSF